MDKTPLPIDPESRPLRIAIRASIVLVPLILILGWLVSQSLGRAPVAEGDLVIGRVVSLRSLQDETGGRTFLVVRLPSAKEVQIRPHPRIPARVGDLVEVRELLRADGLPFDYRLESLAE